MSASALTTEMIASQGPFTGGADPPPSVQSRQGLELSCLSMCGQIGGCGTDCSRAVTYNSYERGLPLYVPFRQSLFSSPFPVEAGDTCPRAYRNVDQFLPNPAVKSIFQRVIDENTGADSRD